jgi:hypothetical protein
MDRNVFRYGYLLAVLAAMVSILPAAGCRNVLTTVAYLWKGTDVEADFNGLQGKKVAVVCRPATSLTFGNATVGAELARQVSNLLRTNVSKIKLIEQQKVAEWTDTHDWSQYKQVGKAVGAEMIVGIELLDFSVYQGQTLYQGKADATVSVVDCADGKMLFEKPLPPSVYPPNTGIPASEVDERTFRRKFILVLADQIARHFYPHDPHADLLQDSAAL